MNMSFDFRLFLVLKQTYVKHFQNRYSCILTSVLHVILLPSFYYLVTLQSYFINICVFKKAFTQSVKNIILLQSCL